MAVAIAILIFGLVHRYLGVLIGLVFSFVAGALVATLLMGTVQLLLGSHWYFPILGAGLFSGGYVLGFFRGSRSPLP